MSRSDVVFFKIFIYLSQIISGISDIYEVLDREIRDYFEIMWHSIYAEGDPIYLLFYFILPFSFILLL